MLFLARSLVRDVNDALLRWPLGAGVALVLIAFTRRFLVADPFLLSALGVAWFAGVVAVYTQRDALPLTERGGRWGGAFAGVTTYTTVTLQQSLSLSIPVGRAFAATLTVLGLVTFAAGVGSALTVRGFGEG